MKTQIENAMLVEVNQVPTADGKVYPTLVLVEVGRRYPNMVRVQVPSDKVSQCVPFVGQSVNVLVEMGQGREGKPYFIYEKISPVKQ